MTIVKNKQGAVIFELDGGDGPDFDSRDLRGHDFTQGVLEGAIFSDANLERTIFREADLYWAVLFRANLRNSILDGALLCGANLKEADLTGASLRGTNLGRDQMGEELTCKRRVWLAPTSQAQTSRAPNTISLQRFLMTSIRMSTEWSLPGW